MPNQYSTFGPFDRALERVNRAQGQVWQRGRQEALDVAGQQQQMFQNRMAQQKQAVSEATTKRKTLGDAILKANEAANKAPPGEQNAAFKRIVEQLTGESAEGYTWTPEALKVVTADGMEISTSPDNVGRVGHAMENIDDDGTWEGYVSDALRNNKIRIDKAAPSPKPKKKIERTVDLGDEVEYIYTDGTAERKKKGVSPTAKARGQRGTYRDERAMKKDFDALPEVKNHVTIEKQMGRVESAMEEAKAGGSLIAVDQALVTILNKTLDEQSVVRESEYARTAQDLSLLSRIRGKVEKIQKGGAGLSPPERKALHRMIKKFADVSAKMYNKQVKSYTAIAERYNFDPRNIVRLQGEEATVSQPESKFKIIEVQ
jgi:hypothetical protein